MKYLKILLLLFIALNLEATGSENEFEELARGYQNQGKIGQAAEFYNKSGYAYWNYNNKAKAAEMFQKAYDLYFLQNNHRVLLTISNNIGLVYLDLEKYNNSYSAFANSLMHAKKLQNSVEIFNSLINLGSVAIELNNYSDAITKANEALNLANEQNNIKGLARTYGLLAESYEKMGDASNAYKFYDLYSTIEKKIKVQELELLKMSSEKEIRNANEKKRITEIELKIKTGELKVTQDSLSISERLSYERKMQLELRNAQLKEKEVELKYERHLRITLIGGISAVLLFLMVLGLMFRQKHRDNKVLKTQKEEITVQRNKLDLQNKKITDSIYYGLRIQKAMLPSETKFHDRMQTFILYSPKDIVSGDFYWYYSVESAEINYQFIAVADCTGHGVPGAFMSMIGYRLLSEIIVDKKIYDPAQILEGINQSLKNDLNQGNNHFKDGMDIALCCLVSKAGKYEKLIFSGAKRNIVLFDSETNKLRIIEGDHKTIGGSNVRKTVSFTDITMPVKSGDRMYLFSDGLIDQHNSNRDRFGTKRFIDIVEKNVQEQMDIQKDILISEFEKFKGEEEQRDDITVFAVKLL